MAPQVPSLDEWRSLSESLGFELDDATLLAMSKQSEGTFAGYARMDELPDDSLPVLYPRTDPGYRPIGDDNPHNGWSWKCSIKGAPEGPLKGKRIGIITEAFGWEGMSQADVDAAVREAAHRFAELGATVEEVSIPMHRDGIVIWSAIAHEGATYKMVVSNAMGSNAKGYYATSLAHAYGKARGAQSRDYPDTVKLTAMIGAYMSKRYNMAYYAKGQNLSLRLTKTYNENLDKYDFLVLPTTPMKAMPLLRSEHTMEEYFTTTLGMLTNTAPFNVTGHPAMSVPVGNSQGLPVGMTIVGRHFEDQKVLSAALAFQESLA